MRNTIASFGAALLLLLAPVALPLSVAAKSAALARHIISDHQRRC